MHNRGARVEKRGSRFINYGKVNGPIAFSLGILCLLWSVGIYFIYKKKKKEYDEME
jgi:hypothetical protein